MAERPTVSADRRQARRSVSVLLVGEAVARFKGVLLIPLLTRYFPADEYGVIAQASVLVAVVLPIVSLGSEAGLARVLPGLDLDRRRRRFTAWMLGLVAASLVLALGLVVAHQIVERVVFGEPGRYARLVPVLAASVVATSIVNGCRSWFRVGERAAALTAATSVQAAMNLLAMAVVLALNGSVATLLAATVASDAVLAVVLVAYLARGRVWAAPDFPNVWPIIRYGLPLLPIGYAVWAMNWFDRLVLVDQDGLTEVGMYSLAYSIAYFAVQILCNPVWMLFPYASAKLYESGQHDPLRRLFRKSLLATVVLVAPFIALTTIVGGELLDLVAPARYRAGRHVIPLVMAGYLAQMVASYHEIALGWLHRQWHSTVGNFLGLGVNVTMNLMLIPRFGMMGAAWATLAGFLVEAVYVMTASSRFGASEPHLWPIARTLLAAAAAGCGAAVATELVRGPDLLVLTTASIAGALTYATGLAALRVVPARVAVSEVRTLIHSLRPAGP